MTNENALEAVELMLLCFPSQGECEIYMDVNIVDDDERLLKLRVNITMQVKSTFLTVGSAVGKENPSK